VGWGLLVDADQAVEEPMQGLASGYDGVRVESLVCLGKGIEETPGIPGRELLVGGLSPFLEDPRDLSGGDGPAIDRFDHEIMGFRIGQGTIPVGLDALIETSEAIAKLTHRSRCEMTKITHRKPGVFPADLDLAGEGQVITAEDVSPGDKTGREGFVVAVSQPDNPVVVLDRTMGETYLEDTEVAISLVTEGMGFRRKLEPGIFELSLDLVNEISVRERKPGVGGSRCGCLEDILARDGFGTAVKEHALRGGGSLGRDGFNSLYHGLVFDWVGTQEGPATSSVTGPFFLLDGLGLESAPGLALGLVVAVAALETGGRNEVLLLDPLDVALHEMEETSHLVRCGRGQAGHDQLRLFCLDEELQLKAAFLFTGRLTIKQGVGAELGLMEMTRQFWIRGAGTRLEIDDAPTGSNEVDHSTERR